MNNKFDENEYNEQSGYDQKTKKPSPVAKSLRWTVYIVCIFFIGIFAIRLFGTSHPGELKNYIIPNEKIKASYAELENDFKIHQLQIRDVFTLGDALFASNVYYLESADNLQLTIRCKNSSLNELNERYNTDIEKPFGYYLKIYNDFTNNQNDYIIITASNEEMFGKPSDRYSYIIVNFDGVEIDVDSADIKVELYLTLNKITEPGAEDNIILDEPDDIARFNLLDRTISLKKLRARDFDLGK